VSDERSAFLSRWSRRKLDPRRVGDVAPPSDAPPQDETTAAPEPAVEGDGELTPDEIAALPKVEDLTADSDITVFLRKGVPALLRNAALRRMWSLDPAIRDYVSEAREYAYDWNVPGGVPGNGPLLPGDDVEAMLGRIFGDGPPGAADGGPAVSPGPAVRPSSQSRDIEPSSEAAVAGSEPVSRDSAAQHEGGISGGRTAGGAAGHEGNPDETAAGAGEGVDAALRSTAPGEAVLHPRPRRHGGAQPL
jgi:hypothetical protein